MFCVSRRYKLRKEKKLFGFVTQKEGIYDCYLDCYTYLSRNWHFVDENDVVYDKAECVLHFHDYIEKTYYFDNVLMANKKKEEIKSLCKEYNFTWIN